MKALVSRPPFRAAIVPLTVALIGGAGLVWHALHYLPFIADDALISLRYSQRLIEGHGLTWTDGKAVEGYSNLLWILLVAALGLFRVDLITAARVLGVGFSLLTLGAVIFVHRRGRQTRGLPMLGAALTLALSGPMAVWAIGGLEQPLVACLLAWGLALTFALFEAEKTSNLRAFLPAVPLAFLCLTRPDGALFTATTALALLLGRGFKKDTFRLIGLVIALPALFYLAQLAFRLTYYGEWVPNTALVKISGSKHHLELGVQYLKNGFLSFLPISGLLPVAALACLFIRGLRGKLALLALPTLAWCAYIAFVGGDIFPAYRHFVPLLVTGALLIFMPIGWLCERWPKWYVAAPLALILGTLLGFYGQRQLTGKENQRGLGERWEWKGQVIGLMLKDGFGQAQPLMAVTAAGCLPYWSELPCLDMLGLNDYHMPRHPPPGFGKGSVAHALGDGKYVFESKPDLIVYGTGHEKDTFLSGKQMARMKAFHEQYSLMQFEGRRPETRRAYIWVRRFSEKIGIQATGTRIRVPCYLFNSDRRTVAFLNENGEFVTAAGQGRPVGVAKLSVPLGRWRLTTTPDSALPASVSAAPSGKIIAKGQTPLVFDRKPEDGPLDIALSPRALVEIGAIVLERMAP